ncbi:MAG: hypothetical protein H7138_11835, partial [Myxococcales bacterium]|nr:hypothetical protein [Myxococcales bacterium]
MQSQDAVDDAFAHRGPLHGVRERLGDAVGRLWAPAIAAISHARGARMFHPEGLTFAGRIEPIEPRDAQDGLAARFSGRVLVRCSAALWRGGREHLDVLGFALRIRSGEGDALDERACDGDQDLLFATIRSPLTMVFSPFTTDASDFAGSTYWAVSPFAVGDLRRVELRLRPVDPKWTKGTR